MQVRDEWEQIDLNYAGDDCGTGVIVKMAACRNTVNDPASEHVQSFFKCVMPQ